MGTHCVFSIIIIIFTAGTYIVGRVVVLMPSLMDGCVCASPAMALGRIQSEVAALGDERARKRFAEYDARTAEVANSEDYAFNDHSK